jgi:ParB/RepB/Spo0J family partition protein
MEVTNYPINTLCDLPVNLLTDHPKNPPQRINEDESMIGLIASIKAGGVHEPLIVTPNDSDDGKFRIVCGHRRRRGSVLAGLLTVPCIIKIYPSVEAEHCAMVVENIQRKSLLLSEQADNYHLLMNGITPETKREYAARLRHVARLTGISESRIHTRLRLRNIIPAIRPFVDLRIISLSKANLLASASAADQAKLFTRAKQLNDADFAKLFSQESTPKTKITTGAPSTAGRKKKPQNAIDDKMFKPEDEFTRGEAIESLNGCGQEAFSRASLMKAFNDACEEDCGEAKNDLICKSCPLPRFVKSVIERDKLSRRKLNFMQEVT